MDEEGLATALEIAMDHEMENPKYYDYLEEMEGKMDADKKKLARHLAGAVVDVLERGTSRHAAGHPWHVPSGRPRVGLKIDTASKATQGIIDAFSRMSEEEAGKAVELWRHTLESFVSRALKVQRILSKHQ